MTLRQLEILRALIRSRTTIAAAEALHLSQPAVSNALKQMESQAGFALFERINNRLFPTQEALALAQDAEAIFGLHARLENRVRDLRESRSGALRIAATPPLGHGAIARLLPAFLAQRPNVKVFLDVKRFEGVTEALENGLADIGFMLGEAEGPALTREALHGGEMVCVLPLDHPLAALDVVTPADLAGHAFIALERGTRMGEALRESFRKADQAFQFVVEVRYCNTACILAANGVGAAVVDPYSPAALPGAETALSVRPFAPATPTAAFAAWSPNRPLSRLAEAFLAELRLAMRR